MFEHYGEQRATEIIKGMVATLKPVITDGHLALARATGAGEYAISLNNYVNLTINVKLAGGPIDVWAMDPVALMFGQVGVSALAPNPNAARLAANFMLSQEAQQFIAKFGRLPTRNDVADNPPGTVAMLQAEEGHSGAADAGGGEGLAAQVPGTVQAAVSRRRVVRRILRSSGRVEGRTVRSDRSCAQARDRVELAGDAVRRRTGAHGRGATARRARWRLIRPRNLALIACVLIAGWLVFVPLAALFYTAFTEDTGFGPGPASLLEFHRGLFELAHRAAVRQFADLRRRHRGR